MIDVVEYDPEKQAPNASFELNKEWAGKVRSFKPGQLVKILVVAKISEVNLRTPYDPDEKGFVGNLRVEAEDFKIDLSQKNEIAELFEDDDD